MYNHLHAPFAPGLASSGIKMTTVLQECYAKARLKQLRKISDEAFELMLERGAAQYRDVVGGNFYPQSLYVLKKLPGIRWSSEFEWYVCVNDDYLFPSRFSESPETIRMSSLWLIKIWGDQKACESSLQPFQYFTRLQMDSVNSYLEGYKHGIQYYKNISDLHVNNSHRRRAFLPYLNARLLEITCVRLYKCEICIDALNSCQALPQSKDFQQSWCLELES